MAEGNGKNGSGAVATAMGPVQDINLGNTYMIPEGHSPTIVHKPTGQHYVRIYPNEGSYQESYYVPAAQILDDCLNDQNGNYQYDAFERNAVITITGRLPESESGAKFLTDYKDGIASVFDNLELKKAIRDSLVLLRKTKPGRSDADYIAQGLLLAGTPEGAGPLEQYGYNAAAAAVALGVLSKLKQDQEATDEDLENISGEHDLISGILTLQGKEVTEESHGFTTVLAASQGSHGGNNSELTVYISASSVNEPHQSTTAGGMSLAGNLHGGANSKTTAQRQWIREQLETLTSNPSDWCSTLETRLNNTEGLSEKKKTLYQNALTRLQAFQNKQNPSLLDKLSVIIDCIVTDPRDGHNVVYGFGHKIYALIGDGRAVVTQEQMPEIDVSALADKDLADLTDYQLARVFEVVARSHPNIGGKNLRPNVDYYMSAAEESGLGLFVFARSAVGYPAQYHCVRHILTELGKAPNTLLARLASSPATEIHQACISPRSGTGQIFDFVAQYAMESWDIAKTVQCEGIDLSELDEPNTTEAISELCQVLIHAGENSVIAFSKAMYEQQTLVASSAAASR
jgi:hypothetical protein